MRARYASMSDRSFQLLCAMMSMSNIGSALKYNPRSMMALRRCCACRVWRRRTRLSCRTLREDAPRGPPLGWLMLVGFRRVDDHPAMASSSVWLLAAAYSLARGFRVAMTFELVTCWRIAPNTYVRAAARILYSYVGLHVASMSRILELYLGTAKGWFLVPRPTTT